MSQQARGALFGLAAAALFGMSAPICKLLLGSMAPQLLAGLLYLGAGIALSAWKWSRPKSAETPLRKSDRWTLLGVVVSGGLLGPVLMLVGLDRVSGLAASLLLNLEGPFTIGLAVLLFREHLGRYGLLAAGLILLGAGLLKLELGAAVVVDGAGVAAIAGACLAWGLDNNLTQRLSGRDPIAIVRVKTLAAGAINLGIALARGNPVPSIALVSGALGIGALSYGASVVMDAYALRWVGAAREAAYFATAPFVGAMMSMLLLGDTLRWLDAAAMGLMVAGVLALLRERHAHAHTHEVLEHEHLHVHDAHHEHAHGPEIASGEPHAHWHRHEALTHDHPHMPDAHHRHRH